MTRCHRKNGFIRIVLPFVALLGCAYFSKEASVQTAVSEDGHPEDAGKVAVPLFIHEKYKAGTDKEWPDSTITDRFVTGLIQHGYDVMDRAHIRKTMLENQLLPKDLYREDNIQKIGMLLHVDTIVLGKLTLIEQQDGNILSRKLNIRGIRVLDGAVLFSLSAVDTTMYHVLSGEDLVDQIIAKMVEPSVDSENQPRIKRASKTEGNIKASAEASMQVGDPAEDTGLGAFDTEGVTESVDTETVEPDALSTDGDDKDGLFVSPEPQDMSSDAEDLGK